MKKFMGTPYPRRWFTSNSHNRLSSEVTGKDGDVIHAYRASDGMVCVNVSQRDMSVIAAAPELLEELQRMVAEYDSEIIDKYEGTRAFDSMLAVAYKARVVIAKALGEKS